VLNDAVTLAPPQRPSEDFRQVGFKIYRPFFITFIGTPKNPKSNDDGVLNGYFRCPKASKTSIKMLHIPYPQIRKPLNISYDAVLHL
jgi:hypothetical protein